MTRNPSPLARRVAALGAACLLALGTAAAHADAGTLQDRYQALQPQLRSNPYGRQMVIDSAEGDHALRGDVYAVLDHPFDEVRQALQDPNAWCDIMLLPFNTKGCRASGNRVTVRIGRRWDSPIDQTYPISFAFHPGTTSDTFLSTRLNAPEGPFGTHDYRVNVEAVPLASGKTFMHMNYAYGYGGLGKFAMQAYLATAGASKVGFTSDGLRGAVERNAMRYYLAIDAYLDTMDAPPGQRMEQRINRWFSATERYPRQLHEMDRGTYLTMKRADYERQQTASLQ